MTQSPRILLRLCTLAAFLGCSLVSFASAQAGSDSKFTDTKVDVLAHSTFLTNPKRQFFVGEDFNFVHRKGDTASTQGVVLRMFPTFRDQAIPPELAFHNPCYVYLSMIASVKVQSDETFFINGPTKEWLKAVPGEGMRASFFTFVFERGVAPEIPTAEFFRLNGGDRDEYFKQKGFMIAVLPGSMTFTDKEVRDLAEAARGAWYRNKGIAESVNDEKHECRWLKLKRQALGDGVELVALADTDCDPYIP